jgi:hypothetical protein
MICFSERDRVSEGLGQGQKINFLSIITVLVLELDLGLGSEWYGREGVNNGSSDRGVHNNQLCVSNSGRAPLLLIPLEKKLRTPKPLLGSLPPPPPVLWFSYYFAYLYVYNHRERPRKADELRPKSLRKSAQKSH